MSNENAIDVEKILAEVGKGTNQTMKVLLGKDNLIEQLFGQLKSAQEEINSLKAQLASDKAPE